tara:strand:- start:9242 stop:10147 length:906 start_codon:yes stop_codon:yes gene_type:complete
MRAKHLIILGTEKAGTTSLYEYFVNHNQIIASTKKETDYFRNNEATYSGYLKCFPSIEDSKILFESSPGYLGTSQNTAPRIHDVLSSNAKLIAVVRDPIERLKSSFSFHKSKQYIPKNFDINEYVDICLAYDNGDNPENPFHSDWFLNVLNAAKYKLHLNNYYKFFDENLVHVIDFHELKLDIRAVVLDICRFADLNSSYFNEFEFFKSNQTFQVKNSVVHRLGMFVNSSFEPFFRRNPKIKQFIVSKYKSINGDDSYSESELSKESVGKLRTYYYSDYLFIKKYLSDRGKEISWENFDGR